MIAKYGLSPAFVCLILQIGLISGETHRFTLFHTTDIHGWVSGHRHEKGFDADFGDFLSFVQRARAQLEGPQQHFLLFDSGDLIEGTGLSDAEDIRGKYIYKVASQVPYTAMTVGNHDIGHANSVEWMTKNFLPLVRPRYVTTNTFLTATNRTMGPPYVVMDLPGGVRMLLLGFMFNFDQYALNTYVMPVEQAVQRREFLDAMASRPDLVVVLLHMDIVQAEYDPLVRTIKSHLPFTPLITLNGHAHEKRFRLIEDEYNSTLMHLESGHYFYDVGVLKFDLQQAQPFLSNVTRQYLPTSIQAFAEWLNMAPDNVPTAEGLALSSTIVTYAAVLDLDHIIGCSERTWQPGVALDDPSSLYALYLHKIAPDTVLSWYARRSEAFMVLNTEMLRYALYAGLVTRDDIITIDPFKDTFQVFYGMSGADLKQLVAVLESLPPYAYARSFSSVLRGGDGWVLPRFVASGDVDATRQYDVVVTSYDATIVSSEMDKLWVGSPRYTSTALPSNMTSTSALQSYVASHMPCPRNLGRRHRHHRDVLLLVVRVAGAVFALTAAAAAAIVYFTCWRHRPHDPHPAYTYQRLPTHDRAPEPSESESGSGSSRWCWCSCSNSTNNPPPV